MKKIHLYISCLLLVVFIGACSKNWLKPEDPSDLSPDNAYNTFGGCKALVAQMCKNLRPEVMGRNSNMKWAYEGSDLAVLVNGSPRNWNTQMVPSIGSKVKELWDNSYKEISRAAMLITRSEKMNGTQEQRDQIRSYGEFFLGYWYYRLTTTYGDVPLILTETDYPKLDFKTSTKQRIITKMISMLEEAVQHLPVNAPTGEINRAAGYMILTKFYLMDGQFEKAIQTSSAVINTPGLALMKTRFGALVGTTNPKIPNPNVMTDLFYKYNPSNSANTEKILVVLDDPYASGGSTSGGGGGGGERMREFLVEWYNGQYDKPQPVQSGLRLNGTGTKSTIDGATGGPGPFGITSNPAQNLQILWTGRGIGAQKKTWYFTNDIWAGSDFERDMRHSAPNWYPMDSLVYNVKTSSLYGKKLIKANCSDTMRCWDDIPYNKIVVDDEKRAAGDYNMLGGFQDWYIYRLAEAYLMRAEALVWLGRGADAIEDINIIRKRAGAAAMTGAATLEDVFDERARELFLEEFRRNEMVRVSFTKAKLQKDGYALASLAQKNWYYDRMSQKNNLFFDVATGQPRHFAYGDGGSNVLSYDISPFHIFWPVPESAINDNTKAQLNQNYGYIGYEKNVAPLE
ncbi:MAG: RagB/SusD family nutrient uptake outer membrane protein [Ginsengibacter sp.]